MFKITAIIWGLLIFPTAPIRAEQAEGDAIVQLLNLFADRTDFIAIANAQSSGNAGNSPAEVVASNLHNPPSTARSWTSSDSTRLQALELGRYVEGHADLFPLGLPNVMAITQPIRLGPFFEGLFPFNPRFSIRHFQKDLTKLQHLLNDSWLDAAAMCGSIQLQQVLLAHRGKLGELLLSYQESQNDIAVILLGETVANYPEALQTIDPNGISTRTLALLLSGSFAIVNPDEKFALIETAARWTDSHPDLTVMLQDLRDPPSLTWFEAFLFWRKGNHHEAVIYLIAHSGSGQRSIADFVMQYFSNAPLSDSEATSLIQLLPDEVLADYGKRAKTRNQQRRISGLVVSEQKSRLTSQTPSP